MNRFQDNPRAGAVIVLILGLFLLALNHFMLTGSDHRYYPTALFGGPVVVLLGVAGIIEPRIIARGGLRTGHETAVFRLIGGVLLLIGLAIGFWLMHSFYGIV